MCSRIHWFSELANSLYCCIFFWPSASNNGWPGGGSGKTSYSWDTYVMMDFSSGSGVSTSEMNRNILLNRMQNVRDKSNYRLTFWFLFRFIYPRESILNKWVLHLIKNITNHYIIHTKFNKVFFAEKELLNLFCSII